VRYHYGQRAPAGRPAGDGLIITETNPFRDRDGILLVIHDASELAEWHPGLLAGPD